MIEGLFYFYKILIVYRDMKLDNVFIYSLLLLEIVSICSRMFVIVGIEVNVGFNKLFFNVRDSILYYENSIISC